MMRILATAFVTALAAASSLGAQMRPVELVPKPAPKTWTVDWFKAKAKPVWTYPAGTLVQLRNFAPGQWSCAKVISERIPILAKIGTEPRARLTITARQSSKIQNGHGACWWEVIDYDRGARLGIYRGSTKDELVSFAVQIPDQGPYPPVTSVRVIWHPNLSPQALWRVTDISAHRTNGPSVRTIANANMLDIKVERSNFGGYAFGVVGSFTRLPARINLSGFVGTGLLVSPDVILPLPLQPVISHDTALIGVLRRIYWQAIEVGPAFALGWTAKG